MFNITSVFQLIWQARGDSNPQHPVLETGALPIGATGLLLFYFFMNGMLTVKLAIFLQFQFSWFLLLIASCTIVLSLAFRAL